MIKLILTLIMIFTFGTSTVNAEENTTSIEDRIIELAEIKSDSQAIIKAKVDELSEDELKTVIENVNELTDQTEDDLAIKEAANSKLERMKKVKSLNLLNIVKSHPLTIGLGVLALISMLTAYIMTIEGYEDESKYPVILGVVLIIVMVLKS